MNHNDRLYSYDELTVDKLKEFSEGSNSLYNLLKYCYDNKIVTYACCKGHDDKISKPYISFRVDNKLLIINLLNNVMSSPLANNIFCEIIDFNCLHLSIYIQDVKDSDMLFQTVLNSFNKSINNQYDYIFDLFERLRWNNSILSSITIYANYIQIDNPIYKKIIIQNNETIYTDEKPKPGDRVWQEDNHRLYLPDDVMMDDVPKDRIIRDKEIFKDTINIPCTVIVDNEFMDEFYDKVKNSQDIKKK